VITNFTKQNDSLDNLLRVALRPYDLKVQPHARLLLFFNFDGLTQWYATILQQEMTTTVREVIAVS